MTQFDSCTLPPEEMSLTGKVRCTNNRPPKNPVLHTKIYSKEEIENLNKERNNGNEKVLPGM